MDALSLEGKFFLNFKIGVLTVQFIFHFVAVKIAHVTELMIPTKTSKLELDKKYTVYFVIPIHYYHLKMYGKWKHVQGPLYEVSI